MQWHYLCISNRKSSEKILQKWETLDNFPKKMNKMQNHAETGNPWKIILKKTWTRCNITKKNSHNTCNCEKISNASKKLLLLFTPIFAFFVGEFLCYRKKKTSDGPIKVRFSCIKHKQKIWNNTKQCWFLVFAEHLSTSGSTIVESREHLGSWSSSSTLFSHSLAIQHISTSCQHKARSTNNIIIDWNIKK